jgi:hypothetical protein
MNDKTLLVEVQLFKSDPTILKESLENGSQPFRVKGILQRAGVKNQNGRIYPKEVLVREAKKYNDTYIRERRALGEIDHPDCLTQSAQILTRDGWKYIKDISNDEEVLTLNLTTNKPEYQRINEKIEKDYSGKMLRVLGKNIDTVVTPNHRFVIENRTGELVLKTASELKELNDLISTHLKIPKSNLAWEVDSPEKFILKGVQNIKSKNPDFVEKYNKDVEINFDVWMSFMGIWLAEGHCKTTRRDGKKSLFNSFDVVITQKKPEMVLLIEKLLNKFPTEIEWKKRIRANGTVDFYVSDIRLWTYLSPLGSCYDKYIPLELKNQSSELLDCLLDWYHKGDGRCVNDRGYLVENVFSTSKRLIEDLQEIQLKCGGNGNILIQESTSNYKFADRVILSKNKSPLYVLKFNKSRYIHIDNRFLKIEEFEFNDKVYCVRLPNQTFYCKDNEKCFWSGNSQIINLKNVSHTVTELHWEGDDLIGTVEILTTPSGNILRELFRNKINVGISSRALGSLTKISENTSLVGEDLELIAFDFVSNPSTAGAFMFLDHAAKLNESVQKIKNPETNNWESIGKIVRDILAEIN